MIRRLRSAVQSGDTIVEVLIAIVVIVSVLMGAFLVTQRSTRAVRAGQEHSEMLQILQGQIERVRAIALASKTTDAQIFDNGVPFCIDTTTGNIAAAASPPCQKIQSLYDVSIVYNAGTKVYTFTGTWFNLSGGKDQEQLTYRVYSGAPITYSSPGIPITPGGGGNASGDAFFGNLPNTTCGGVNQPPCIRPVPDGKYHYSVRFSNQSHNDQSKVLGCSWNWGDGKTETFAADAPQCKFEGLSNPHAFPKPADEKKYPADCGRTPYTVTLTMFIQGVNPYPAWPRTLKIPTCGT